MEKVLELVFTLHKTLIETTLVPMFTCYRYIIFIYLYSHIYIYLHIDIQYLYPYIYIYSILIYIYISTSSHPGSILFKRRPRFGNDLTVTRRYPDLQPAAPKVDLLLYDTAQGKTVPKVQAMTEVEDANGLWQIEGPSRPG